MKIIRSIQNRIYEIRGERVMIDSNIATLLGVDVNVVNLAARRRSKLFHRKFMFQLREKEWEHIRFQIENMENRSSLNLQMVTIKEKGEQLSKLLPYVFTGKGVAILKEILSSGIHCINFSQLYEAMENLLDENVAKKKWEERERIGFKK